MAAKPSERRIIMARMVASEWLSSRARAEYRIRVYYNQDLGNYVNLLRGFRDGQVKIAGVQPIPDLGIQHENGSLTVWSSDHNALASLKVFFEKKGMETSWIW